MHYRDDTAAGGSLKVGESLCRYVDPRVFEMHACFAYGGPGPVGSRAPFPCHYLGLRSSRDVARWVQIRRLLRRHRFSILHFQDPLLWAHTAAAGIPAARIVHVHGQPLPVNLSGWSRLVLRLRRHCAHRFVCVNHATSRLVEQLGFAHPAQTAVLYNGVDVDWLQQRPGRPEARQMLALPAEARIAGMVCRLDWGKGGYEFVRAVKLLGEHWHGVVAGDGPERPAMQAAATDMGVSGRVHFLGFVPDVRPVYAAMDAYVFLAHYESFGLVLAEAMACRVPVFGLRGLGEYTEPENPLVTRQTACLLDRRNPRDLRAVESDTILQRLADRMEACVQEPASSREMVEQAWRHVQARFSSQVQAREMARIYASLLRQHPATS